MTTPCSPLPPVYDLGFREPWLARRKRPNPGMLRRYKEDVGFGLYKWSVKKYPK